ncbi:MAG: hypothetical protein FI729_01410 [SAR202 cluster bacterium]|nr:hypothetical protein [SAR202 cluster bacterium]
MGRPIVCNTCCPSDDPPPPTDCFGAIGVVFMDESDMASRQAEHVAALQEKIDKYLRAFPDRLIFFMDVEPGRWGSMDYNEWPQFVSSDRCYSLRLEYEAGLSVPQYIKRDSTGFVSDVYDYIVEIVTNSSKSTDEVREIWNTSTEVSVFRDNSGSMFASHVQKTHDKFDTDLQSNGKHIVSSESNGNEDFICPFVFEQCCINQDAADLLKICLDVECTPAELRFLKDPNNIFVIDDPCDSLLLDNTAEACDNCPEVRPDNHEVKYTAAAVQSDGATLNHIDVDYYLQYRDSEDDNFVDLYDLPNDKGGVEQTLDVLLRKFICKDDGGGASSTVGGTTGWKLVDTKVGDDYGGTSYNPEGFGFCIDISADGEYIVVGPSRNPQSVLPDGKQGKIVTFRREVFYGPDIGFGDSLPQVRYNLLNTLDIEDMELVNTITKHHSRNDITITPDGRTMVFSCHGLGPAHSDSFFNGEFFTKAVGKTFVYDLLINKNVEPHTGTWVQRGSAITWDDIGIGGSGGSVEISVIREDGKIKSIGDTVLVCPSNDGNRSHNNIAARVFSWNGTAWIQKGQDLVIPGLPSEPLINGTQKFVFDSAMSDDGSVIALSEIVHNTRGIVRVYEYNTSTSQWDIRHDFVGEKGQHIGSAIGMSTDGTRVAFFGYEGNPSVTSANLSDISIGDFTFTAYDWNGSSYTQVGNTIKFARSNANLLHSGQQPQIDFADKDIVALNVQLDKDMSPSSTSKTIVFKLIGNTWVQQGGDFLAGTDNNISSFGTGTSISRTGFIFDGEHFGHTLVFGDHQHDGNNGKIYIYMGKGNFIPPDDDNECEKVSCHPLISEMGNPPSSCDAFTDQNIGNGCAIRLFNREFRIRASNDSLTTVFSKTFKLYRYLGTEDKPPNPPSGSGKWIELGPLGSSYPAQPYETGKDWNYTGGATRLDPFGVKMISGLPTDPTVNKGHIEVYTSMSPEDPVLSLAFSNQGSENEFNAAKYVAFASSESAPFGLHRNQFKHWIGSTTFAYTYPGVLGGTSRRDSDDPVVIIVQHATRTLNEHQLPLEIPAFLLSFIGQPFNTIANRPDGLTPSFIASNNLEGTLPIRWGAEFALDGDGDTMIVSDPYGQTGEEDCGRVWIYRFRYDYIIDGRPPKVEAIATFAGENELGLIVSPQISEDGSIIGWVEPGGGDTGAITGNVRIYKDTTGSPLWKGTQRPVLPNYVERPIFNLDTPAVSSTNKSIYKMRLSNDGDTFIISGGTLSESWVKVFTWDGTKYMQKGQTFTGCGAGWDISISADGQTIAYSTHEANPELPPRGAGCSNDDHGSVYVYSWNGSAWNQVGQTITSTNTEGTDRVGNITNFYRFGNRIQLVKTQFGRSDMGIPKDRMRLLVWAFTNPHHSPSSHDSRYFLHEFIPE